MEVRRAAATKRRMDRGPTSPAENIEGKNDPIATVLNELARQERLKRCKVDKQKVLWSWVSGEITGQNGESRTRMA